MDSKKPSESSVETRYLLMPHQANPHGNAFGGAIMAWIDMVASMAAQRHCGREVVTLSVDSLIFKKPIYVGDNVVLKSSVNYVGNTSMEVGVKVIKEDPYSHEQIITTTSYLTFVSLDINKRPAVVIPISPETEEEKRRYKNAKLRVNIRKEILKKIE